MSDDNEDNIVKFGAIQGGKTETPAKEDDLPQNTYAITDVDGVTVFCDGFLVFTSHHIAVMKDLGDKGAIPAMVFPLSMVKCAELVEPGEDDTEELPF